MASSSSSSSTHLSDLRSPRSSRGRTTSYGRLKCCRQSKEPNSWASLKDALWHHPRPSKTTRRRLSSPTLHIYDTWIAQDQQVLGYLINSLSTTVLAHVATLKMSSEVWTALEGMYSAQSRARVTNLQMQLASLRREARTSQHTSTR